MDLVAGAVWWFLFGSFFSSCFEEQWLILMIDFCGYVAGEAFFWVQGRNFLFDSCAVESAKVEGFKGAVSFWRSFLSSLKFGGEV